MRWKHSRSLAFLGCLLGSALLASCAPTLHRALDLNDLERIEKSNLRATITQEEPTIHVVKSTAGDNVAAGGGLCCVLIGSVVDKQIDASRSRKAEAWIAPLLEVTSDVDFRKDYWEALLPALQALPWLKLGETELAVGPEELPDEWLEENVMLISSSNELTADGRGLVVGSSVKFWNEPDSKPSYFAFHSYVSGFMDTEDGEAAMAMWAANGAERYRAALAEGIRESIRMIRLDLPDAEKQTGTTTGTPAEIKIPPLIGGGALKVKGEILEQGEDRVLFRAATGNLFSLPRADIEIKDKTR